MHQLEGLKQLYEVTFNSRHTQAPLKTTNPVPAASILAVLSPDILIPIGQLEVVRIVRAIGYIVDSANSGHLRALSLNVFVNDSVGNTLAASGLVGDDTLIGAAGVATDRFEDQAFVWNDTPANLGMGLVDVYAIADVRNDDAALAHNVDIAVAVTYEVWRLSRR